MRAFFLSLILCSSYYMGFAEDAPRVQWTMDETYQGPHQASFNKLRYEVPILMRQTMIDLAVRCGLDFNEGWKIPLVVRFDDESPAGAENVLAYVQMLGNSRGDLVQQLVINLEAYDKEGFNFDKVFAHELVHAMLNDSLGENSGQLPVWFHEGLAVYGANQGEQLLEAVVSQGVGESIFNGLDGPHGGRDYLEDYLAFKYVHDRHGVSSLQNLIRDVTRRQGNVHGAIEYTCQESWEEFQQNAKDFSIEELARANKNQRLMPYHSDKKLSPY